MIYDLFSVSTEGMFRIPQQLPNPNYNLFVHIKCNGGFFLSNTFSLEMLTHDI